MSRVWQDRVIGSWDSSHREPESQQQERDVERNLSFRLRGGRSWVGRLTDSTGQRREEKVSIPLESFEAAFILFVLKRNHGLSLSMWRAGFESLRGE